MTSFHTSKLDKRSISAKFITSKLCKYLFNCIYYIKKFCINIKVLIYFNIKNIFTEINSTRDSIFFRILNLLDWWLLGNLQSIWISNTSLFKGGHASRFPWGQKQAREQVDQRETDRHAYSRAPACVSSFKQLPPHPFIS